MNSKFLLILISLPFFCLNFSAKGQDYIDFAQAFSQREIGGTARMQGMGGASSSLGGDISSTIINPAGLGFFNRSEFSFSPSLGFHSTNAEYLGTSTEDYKNNFNFGSLGVVLNNTKSNPTGAWRGGSFGISMTRINDFHGQVNYRGANGQDDFIGYVLEEANASAASVSVSADPADFLPDLSYLAYSTYLIDPYEESGELFFDSEVAPPTQELPVTQSELITTKGAGYSTSFAYGGNFADKFYFGAAVSFSSIEYEIERIYTEIPTETVLRELNFEEYREVDGVGFNLSLGAIYRPIDALTVGLSYTSPTYYSLEDQGSIRLVSQFYDDAEIYDENVDYAPFQFEYRTPGRLNTGISYIIGKSGLITAELEYLDYSGNRYSSDQDDFSVENEHINSTFNSVINYKVGGEYRLNIFRFRAGYAFFDDPTNNSLDNIDKSRQSFSIGAGVRLQNYYVDLGVINTRYDSGYLPIYPGGSFVPVENNFTRGIVTLGFNF